MRSLAVGFVGRSIPGGKSGVSEDANDGVEVNKEEMFPGERTSVSRASSRSACRSHTT